MILIRADANETIGTGHVMRCLSIAKAFACRNVDVLFVSADEKSKGLITQNSFNSVSLHTDYTEMESELEAMKGLIQTNRPSLLLIDSYYVTEQYFEILSDLVKTAYIDDINRARWDVDLLINYNVFSSAYDYSAYEGTKTKLILHPEFAPLRDEFKNCPPHTIKNVTDILVSAGGADPEQITEKILIGICPELPGIRFHFIVGALNSRMEDIKALASNTENAILHINERHMSDLMRKCDIAISAAGSTLYELCAMGVPTIAYSLADNQIVATEQFEKHGIMLNAGDCRKNICFTNDIKQGIIQLANNKVLRESLSLKMQSLVDGKGADRIARSLMKEMATDYDEK